MIELNKDSPEYNRAAEAFKYVFSQVHGEADPPLIASIWLEGGRLLHYDFEDGSSVDAIMHDERLN